MVLQNSGRGPFCTSEISDTLNSVAPVVIDPLQKALDTALLLLTGGGLPKGLQRFSMIYYLPGHRENSGLTKTRTTRCRWHSYHKGGLNHMSFFQSDKFLNEAGLSIKNRIINCFER